MLHPFPDGNCRTFACVTMNHVLMAMGLPPAIIYDPNLDAQYSAEEFAEEIRKGISITERLLVEPDAVVFNFGINDMPQSDIDKFSQYSSGLIEAM